MKKLLIVFILFAILISNEQLLGQNDHLNEEAKSITYESIYDNPYDINKLFIHLQPMYAELFATNITMGWGIKGHYYLKNKADFEAHVRAPFARAFDLTRDAAHKNSTVDNEARAYSYFELLGTYHIKDFEEDTDTKFILYSKRYKGDKWAATVPLHTIIPTKVRKIIGARAGGMAYQTSVDYNRIMDKQGVTLTNSEGVEISANESVYGNMASQGIYIGGSYGIIKNVAVQPDKIYGTLVSDLIFTVFLDVSYAPSIVVDDIYVDGVLYSSEPIQQNALGFRSGVEGKFNRKFGMAYSFEIGVRPGIQQSGFFALAKISFPVFATQLRHQVESFGK